MMTYNLPVLTAIIQLVQDTILRPSSILFYPVRAAFSREGQLDHVIGSISIVFSWDDVLSRILPSHLHGLVCVLQTNTGQEFTFRLGDKVEFLGQGDLHDSSFDSLAYPVDANLEETNKVLGNVDHLITYQLIVYPSVQFESQYKTSKPALYTFGVVLIFFCTAALFCLYDYLVTMRQSTVAKAAQQTGDIVNAMFPAAFRDRLFRAQELQSVDNTNTGGRDEGRPRQRKGGHLASSEHGRLTGFVGSSIHVRSMKKFIRGKGIHPGEYNVDVNFRDAPIADLFPATSIMFCDIVGFTQWSAQHGPNEVFQLLETLFWEFDQLAEKYGVFKLGTIGDCYIAVTGIPEPIPNHASILAEFTIECKKKVVEVTSGLSSLDGVANLSMRFGIHSGPITAGILRGKKSRFELFGDTINSASRMESTSLPNCIQVSEETAAYLREEGMGGWLAPREGLVSVKGKGQLSTFWLISPTDDDEKPCNTARALSWTHRRRRSSFLAAFGFSESKPAKPSGWSHSDAVITEMEEGRR
jgi:class 3 adenylate cyclase